MPTPDVFPQPPSWTDLILDRRVILKTATIFGALLAGGFAATRIDEADAQSTTRAIDWYAIDADDLVQAADSDGFITLETDFPFTAVGANWNAILGDWPQVEIRFSADGMNYSDTIILAVDPDTGRTESDARLFTRLAFSNGDSLIQYRILDADGIPVHIDSFGLTYIDASEGPTLGTGQLVEAADVSTPPGIISRTGWGADESLRFSNGVERYPPEYATIHHGIVHHSDTPNADDPMSQMRSIYYYHTITQGWGDIGYNYLVDKYGNIYQGRIGGQAVVGTHAAGHNFGSVGVCLIGNHLAQAPTQSAVSGVVAILAFALRGLDPLGASDAWNNIGLPTICGHRDVFETTCPGDFAYADLTAIRNAVAQTQANPPAGPPGGFVIGDIVAIATDDGTSLNLRSAPGIDSSIMNQLPDGSLAGIVGGPTLATDTNWYRVDAAAGNGWVTTEFLQLAPRGVINTPHFAIDDTIQVTATTAELRTQPRASAELLATISTGTQLRVTDGPRFRDGNVWYLGAGAGIDAPSGWTNQALYQRVSTTQPGTESLQPGDQIVVTSAVNLRMGPTTAASIIDTLPLGTAGMVLGGPTAANGYNWYQLQTALGLGWSVSNYLRKTTGGNTPDPTPTQPPQPTQTPTPPPNAAFTVGDTIRASTAVNLRANPAVSGSLLRTLATGTTGVVLAGPIAASGYSWYQLQTGGITGWSAGEFFVKTFGSSPSPTPTAPIGAIQIGDTVKTTDTANIRAGAGLSATILTTLLPGANGTVLSGPTLADGYNWYRLQTATQTGWVAHILLAKTAPPSSIQIGNTVRTSTSLRLRSLPSTMGMLIATMPTGTTGSVLGGPTTADSHIWFQLTTTFGTGWAAGEYLRKVQ